MANQIDNVSLYFKSLPFVVAYGATLNVQKPGVPILSTGSMSYPLNRPIGAVYAHPVRYFISYLVFLFCIFEKIMPLICRNVSKSSPFTFGAIEWQGKTGCHFVG
jgi:hypothetical protein